jgi:hypothetical protein
MFLPIDFLCQVNIFHVGGMMGAVMGVGMGLFMGAMGDVSPIQIIQGQLLYFVVLVMMQR